VTPPNLRHELATAAYSHACAVLGVTSAAVDAAVVAVRTSGPTKASVLALARAAALERAAGGDTAAEVSVEQEAPQELESLARLLASTRPPEERAVVDLDARQGLDPAGLGEALGLPPAAAASRVSEVAAAWQAALDPVLLARLGPGPCHALADVLRLSSADENADDAGSRPPPTLGQLLAAGEAVSVHADGCEICRDRLRAMVSVRTLLAQQPLEEPPSVVRAAANTARLGAPEPRPPLQAAVSIARRRWPVAAVVGGAVLVALAGGALAARNERSPSSQIEAMTKLPASSNALTLNPVVVDAAESPTVRLRNLLTDGIEWTATPDKPWLLVVPASGVLRGEGTGDVVIGLRSEAPEGELQGSVTFTGNDGSTAVVKVRSSVARPPDIAVRQSACEVVATVEDESDLSSVVLHQRVGSADQRTVMRAGSVEGEWVASLVSRPEQIVWWVSARDALGNEGRTADQRTAAADC